jgi:hypothetical protein
MTIEQFNDALPRIVGKQEYVSKSDFLDYLAYFMTKKSFDETIEKIKNEIELAKYLYRGSSRYFCLDKKRIEENLGCRIMINYETVKIINFSNGKELQGKKIIKTTSKQPPLTGLEEALSEYKECDINEVVKMLKRKSKKDRIKIFNENFLPLIKNKNRFENYLEFMNYRN